MVSRNLRMFRSLAVIGALLLVSQSVIGCLPPPPPGPNGEMSPAGFIIESVYFFLAIFGVYWLLVLRPSEGKFQEQKKFIDELKKNDEVVLTGGMYGRVVSSQPTFITVEIAPNVRVKVDPAHVKKPKAEPNDKVVAAAPAGTTKG